MPALTFNSPAASAQERLIEFLLDPESYPHRPRDVRMVQTHASFVFIAPPFVYKVKKPVNLGFLDYSTLEKRRHFCQREVQLNQRLCSDVYLAVVPISLRAGSFTFSDAGTVVEYAVKMRQLSEDRFLDKLVERGAVKPDDLHPIVAALKSFYEAHHPTKEIEAWGQVDRLKISTNENFEQTRRFVGHTLSPLAFEVLRFYTDVFYARHAELFESRVREGWIRDGHGDLRLEHIHLMPRELCIYDCIEFNDRLRYVDVANDVAFLAMDFDFRGRSDLARLFGASMAAALKDNGMERLLDFYKCYRAYIRGKVESLSAVERTAPDAARQASNTRARHYFRLALQYTSAGSRPQVIIVMGRIGTGKSTLALALAAELGWEVLSSDRIRKELAGLPLYSRTGNADRLRLYSSATTDKTYERLLELAENKIRDGHSVILDATFSRRSQRNQLHEQLPSRGIAVRIIEAQASDEAIKQRLGNREHNPAEVSDARLEDFETLTELYEPPTEWAANMLTVAQTATPLEQTVTFLLKALAQAQVGSM